MRDKFMWHLTENMDEGAIDANKIQLEGVKFKIWNFRGVVCNSTIKKKKNQSRKKLNKRKGRLHFIKINYYPNYTSPLKLLKCMVNPLISKLNVLLLTNKI